MPDDLPRDIKRTKNDVHETEFVSADDQIKLDDRRLKRSAMNRGANILRFFGITTQDRPPSGPR